MHASSPQYQVQRSNLLNGSKNHNSHLSHKHYDEMINTIVIAVRQSRRHRQCFDLLGENSTNRSTFVSFNIILWCAPIIEASLFTARSDPKVWASAKLSSTFTCRSVGRSVKLCLPYYSTHYIYTNVLRIPQWHACGYPLHIDY